LPFSTMPPMRKVRPCGAFCSTTSVGVKKKTRFCRNALSTSAATMPSATTPPTMAAMRLYLGFTASLHPEDHFKGQASEGHHVSPPHAPRIAAHREEVAHAPLSRMMQRPRTSAAAMLYIQNARAITIIPVNITGAMLGALLKLTEAP